MAWGRKALILGAIALVLSAGIVGVLRLSNREGSADGRAACEAWNGRARETARVRAVQLRTGGAQVAVFLDLDASARVRTDVESFIKRQLQVKTVVFQSKEDAHAAFAELFADDQTIVRATPVEALPESFRVVLRSADDGSYNAFTAAVEKRPGVHEVRDDRQATDVNVRGPLFRIQAQGFYLAGSGRVDRPAGCIA